MCTTRGTRGQELASQLEALHRAECHKVFKEQISTRIARVEPRRRVRQLVLDLLSDPPRKNSWTISEWAGEATPDGMQHLLGRAKWDADQVRDDIRGYVVEHLHHDRAVLVIDETGDVKTSTPLRGGVEGAEKGGRRPGGGSV